MYRRWVEGDIRKDASRLNSKLASTTDTQIQSSQTTIVLTTLYRPEGLVEIIKKIKSMVNKCS